MPNYRRSHAKGGTYFFTVVTYHRSPVFNRPECINYLRESIIEVRRKLPFNIDAWVLLPDHMHCIWTLPDQDRDYSRRWGLLKSGFSKRVKDLVSLEKISASRIKHHEASVSQRRFWEHQIRNEEDFNNIDPEKITRGLNENFSPEIAWDVNLHEFQNKTFGLLYTYESENKPIVAKRNSGEVKEAEVYYRYRGRTGALGPCRLRGGHRGAFEGYYRRRQRRGRAAALRSG